MPQPYLYGFHQCFLLLCEDFDDSTTIDFCHVHDFVDVDLGQKKKIVVLE